MMAPWWRVLVTQPQALEFRLGTHPSLVSPARLELQLSQKTGGPLGLAGFHPSRKTANPPSEILTHGKRWNNRDQDTWCPLLTSMHMQRHTPIHMHVQTLTQTHTCMQARIQIRPYSKIWNPILLFLSLLYPAPPRTEPTCDWCCVSKMRLCWPASPTTA